MSLSAAVIRELVAAGVTGDALVAACERIEATAYPARTKGAERTARWRNRKAEASQSVTVTDSDADRERVESINNTTNINNNTHTPSLSQNVTAGRIAVSVMRDLPAVPDHAGQLQRAVADALEFKGFVVRCEAPTTALGDDREGRVDILATIMGGVVAIEIDARKPRARSLKKLRLFNAFRIIALRGVDMEPPDGIDAVVALKVAAVQRPELDGFQEFYDAYPRHIARGTAERAWPAAVSKAGSAAVLCEAARAFRRKCVGKDENYIPHPATWLNGARWQDEDLRPAASIAPLQKRVAVHEGTPAWDAWKRTGRRFNAMDLKDDNGHVIGRGWYFETEFPAKEQAA